MTDRIRAALQRLAKLEGHILVDCTTDWAEAMIEARAALAEPVGEGPSLGEVEDLCEEHCFNVEGYESIECLQGLINEAIFRWGHQPAPPAEGEVGEWVQWLREQAEHEADLLEQRHPTPVPVAERLPGPEDCDAEGRVWLFRPQTPILNPYWDLVKLDYIDPVPPTHWLPATALPLPSGEAQP